MSPRIATRLGRRIATKLNGRRTTTTKTNLTKLSPRTTTNIIRQDVEKACLRAMSRRGDAEKEERLFFCDGTISVADGEKIGRILSSNKAISILSVRKALLEQGSVENIIGALLQSYSSSNRLRELDLSHCEFADSSNVARNHIAPLIRRNNRIQKLNLSHTNLDKESIRHILEALEQNETMVECDLSCTAAGDQDLMMVATILSRNIDGHDHYEYSCCMESCCSVEEASMSSLGSSFSSITESPLQNQGEPGPNQSSYLQSTLRGDLQVTSTIASSDIDGAMVFFDDTITGTTSYEHAPTTTAGFSSGDLEWDASDGKVGRQLRRRHSEKSTSIVSPDVVDAMIFFDDTVADTMRCHRQSTTTTCLDSEGDASDFGTFLSGYYDLDCSFQRSLDLSSSSRIQRQSHWHGEEHCEATRGNSDSSFALYSSFRNSEVLRKSSCRNSDNSYSSEPATSEPGAMSEPTTSEPALVFFYQ